VGHDGPSPPPISLGTATWHGDPVTVSLHAADSGGAGILYSELYVNGAPAQFPLVSDATHTIAVDGDNIIAWQVYDRAYNCSTTAIGELKIDLLPPITIVSGADDAWHNGPVPVTFSATDVHGKVAGSAGCNRYTATYTSDGQKLTIGPAGATRKMCAQPDGVMEQEQQFLRALETVTTARFEGDRLELRTVEGALAMTLTKVPG